MHDDLIGQATEALKALHKEVKTWRAEAEHLRARLLEVEASRSILSHQVLMDRPTLCREYGYQLCQDCQDLDCADNRSHWALAYRRRGNDA